MNYDYFIGGRWRNHEAIREVLDAVKHAGKSAYCFIDNAYHGDGIIIDTTTGADVETFMRNLETIEDWRTNLTFRQIYDNDMKGLKSAREAVFVLPLGASAHMELGAAFGLGKKCYGVGRPEKHEPLYLMFDEIYPDAKSFVESPLGVAA